MSPYVPPHLWFNVVWVDPNIWSFSLGYFKVVLKSKYSSRITETTLKYCKFERHATNLFREKICLTGLKFKQQDCKTLSDYVKEIVNPCEWFLHGFLLSGAEIHFLKIPVSFSSAPALACLCFTTDWHGVGADKWLIALCWGETICSDQRKVKYS